VKRSRPIFLAACCCLAVVSPLFASCLRVAVATNFLEPARILAERFTAQTRRCVDLSSGSTGILFAQIRHGAPYDLFFAADSDRPARLERLGLAKKGSRFTYAVGRLALWTGKPELLQGANTAADVLGRLAFSRLAMADPATAPYGQAARQFLAATGLWPRLRDRIVYGANVGQALQFVVSGGAELGLVALSQVMSPALRERGAHLPVPEHLHDPIRQQAVILVRARPPWADRFVGFVRSAEAAAVLAGFGYQTTGTAP